MNMVDIIQWPKSVDPDVSRVSDSFPLIGVRSRITRMAKGILNSRSHEQTIRIWSDQTAHVQSALMMLRIVRVLTSSFLRWPNWYFFPQDCAQIPYCDFRGMNPDFEDVIGPFCEIYGICSTHWQCELMNIIGTGSMLDVFVYVSSHFCCCHTEKCLSKPYFSKFGLY